jgi:hypothetical protein
MSEQNQIEQEFWLRVFLVEHEKACESVTMSGLKPVAQAQISADNALAVFRRAFGQPQKPEETHPK